jgi:hypothetical protein
MLPSAQGRGKGSGPKATPDAVALLIISRMLTDNLSDANENVRELANADLIDRKRETCQWTGARIFRDAVSALFSARGPLAHANRIGLISVWRNKPSGGITIFPSIDGTSYFGSGSPAVERRSVEVLQVQSELPFEAIRIIRRELADHIGSEGDFEGPEG